MITLRFEHDLGNAELQGLVLPVEVRKPNLALVARARSSDSIQVESGEYHVTAELPTGRMLFGSVRVDADADEPQTVRLAPDETEGPRPQEVDWRRFVLGSPKKASARRRQVEPRPDQGSSRIVDVDLLSGNVVDGRVHPAGRLTAEPDESGSAELYVPPGRNRLARIQQGPDEPPLNVVLPTSDQHGCWITLCYDAPDSPPSVEVIPENPAAAAALHYYSRGMLWEAGGTSDSGLDGSIDVLRAKSAERSLAEKVHDPVAAAVGAYMLLRIGEISRLHDWTENLFRWFDWLPDGAVIRAEHLARLGKHEEAVHVLLEIPHRGLPIFSDGLSYATGRLRSYAMRPRRGPEERLRDVLARLEEFEVAVDHHHLVTRFPGSDPTLPSARAMRSVVVEAVPPARASEVSEALEW